MPETDSEQSHIQTPNPMVTLYSTETILIVWTRTLILIQIQIPDHYCFHFWDGYVHPDRDPSPSPVMEVNHYITEVYTHG